MPIAALGGTDLYYEEHGDGPAVVFLHGMGSNHLAWWQQIPVFQDDYRCITIDHRGFGPSNDASLEGPVRFSDDLEGLLDHLNVERAALVCQSMGGNTAIRFAVSHPERVSALVMGGTWGFFDWAGPTEHVRNALASGRAAAPTDGTPALGMSYKSANPTGAFLYGQMAALNPPRQVDIVSLLPVGAPTPEDVAQLRIPALFIIGLDDVVVAVEDMRATCALITGAELVEFSGLGHSAFWEDPAAFNKRVSAFLARHL